MKNPWMMIKMTLMILQVPLCPQEEEEQEVDHVEEENVGVLLLQALVPKEAEVGVEEEVDHLQKHSRQPVIHHQKVQVILGIAGKVVGQKKVIIAGHLVLAILLHSL